MPVVLLNRNWTLTIGEQVYLVQPSYAAPIQTIGIASQLDSEGFVLTIEEDLPTVAERCVFAVSSELARLACTGFVQRRGRFEVACRPLSPWQEVSTERRTTARYPSALKAIAQSGDKRAQLGTVVNISEGGCALATRTPLTDESVDLSVRFETYSARLRCRVVGSTQAPNSSEFWFVNHLQFESLHAAQQAFLRQMLDSHEIVWARKASPPEI
jgi:hypothetical protein